MSQLFAVLGAAFYFAWGALHLLAAVNSFSFAANIEADLVQGRLFQGAFYVAIFAVVAVIVALGFNWRNSRAGFWINLITVSTADIPFVLFIVLPGHMTGLEAVLGPSLWIGGVVMSTLALATDRRN